NRPNFVLCAVNEFRSQLDGRVLAVCAFESINAAAGSRSRFQNQHGKPLIQKRIGCGQTGGAGSNDDHIHHAQICTGNAIAANRVFCGEILLYSPFNPAFGSMPSLMITRIGRNMAMTMLPTITARNTIIKGSSKEVSALAALSTSLS